MGLRCSHLSAAVLSTLRNSEYVFIDTYTSIYQENPVECLKKYEIIAKPVGREFLESSKPLEYAERGKTSIAVIGHPLVATTHHVLVLDASKKGIPWNVVDNISAIEVAKAKSGLSIYRFGKIVTVMFPREGISFLESVKNVIDSNDSLNLHTILLLETGYDKTMKANEAASLLVNEYPELSKRRVIAMARLTWDEEEIIATTFEELTKIDMGRPPHLIIIPSPKLHPIEEEWLKMLEKSHRIG